MSHEDDKISWFLDESNQECESLTPTKPTVSNIIINNLHMPIGRLPSNISVLGTTARAFLTKFVTRTAGFEHSLVKIELIQKKLNQINNPNSDLATLKNVSKMDKIKNCAEEAYFLAALALGSVQCGIFDPELQNKQYQMLNCSMRMCYQQEQVEVVTAHLLISAFCFIAGQFHNYKKHIGFASVLRNLLEDGNSICQRKLLHHAEDFMDYLSAGHLILELFVPLFFGSQEVFDHHFPLFYEYVAQTTFKGPDFGSYQLEPRKIDSYTAIMKAGSNASTLGVVLATSDFFQDVVSNFTMSQEMKIAALEEIKKIVTIAKTAFQRLGEKRADVQFVDNTGRFYLTLVEAFCSITAENFEEAKRVLRAEVPSWDCYTLSYVSGLPLMEHFPHFVIIALSVLKMVKEYNAFKEKMNKVLKQTDHNGRILPDILPMAEHGTLNSMCDKSACIQAWGLLNNPGV